MKRTEPKEVTVNVEHVVIAGDQAGFHLRQHLVRSLAEAGFDVSDLGPSTPEAAPDYPDVAREVASLLKSGAAARAILVCGSGVGAVMAANKIAGVYAGLCHDTYSARQGVEHDDMNVLCLGARVIGSAVADEIARAFLAARFAGEERHVRRIDKMKALERAVVDTLE